MLLILPLPSASIPFHVRWIQWRRRHRERARQYRYRKLGLLPLTRGRTIDLLTQVRL